MARIIVDSDDLQSIISDIDTNCTMLGYLDEEDDISDIYYYSTQIQYDSARLADIIDSAEPVKGE